MDETTPHDGIDRRTYLGGAALAATAGLAGCSSPFGNGDDGNGDDNESDDGIDPEEVGNSPTVSFAMEQLDGRVVTATSNGPDEVDRENVELRIDGEAIADGSAFSGDGDTVVEGDSAAVYTADGEVTAAAESAPEDASGIEVGRRVQVVWTGGANLVVGDHEVEESD
ncbi:hypothetical protein GJ631_08715 [Natronomonas sp. CBA1123]|uniref:hypothetical protein n=1 Tax=Natronomonas sp. CBA1123 TaxID=2668070 RepID=UPI0012EAC039|nr:hypothetical protein [Natronomonas sp. CBA1123]MUV86645.1 hypothetical protein [Natronomonas sp. CBA1123]